jgi:hypothetical protein
VKEFACSDPSILVAGPVVQTFLSALGPYQGRGEKVVKRTFRVDEVRTDPGSAYPLPAYLTVLQEFQHQFGDGFLQRMGTLIFEKVPFPPDIDGIEKALASIHTAYLMNHANADGKIGGYHWTAQGRAGVLRCDNPYPCSFDLGIVTAIARRFRPDARVTHLAPESCRHHGAESCSYQVEW